MPRVALTLTPKRNGGWTARKRLPKDVRAEYSRLYGNSSEEWFSVGPKPAGDARREAHEWSAEIETRITNIRAGRTGSGQSLSRKDAYALACEWYSWFVARHEDQPGNPQLWEARWLSFLDDLEEHAPEAVWASQENDAVWTWIRSEEARPHVLPIVADTANTAQFLARRGLQLNNDAYNLFLGFVLVEYLEAVKLLERRADGDYSLDTRPQRFPKFNLTKTSLVSDATPMKLFVAWIAARKPAASTVNRWRAIFLNLEEHFKERSAGSINTDEAQAWADGLVTVNCGANTVNEVWCNAAHTVFAWAVKTKRISSNPFSGVKVTSQRKIHSRATPEFTEEEIALILRRATAVEYKSAGPIEAAKRWVPWLCAYTGARVGEITQLRGADVVQREGHWVIHITPDAGTVKTRKPRTVPLHEHLIDQGFLIFARESGNGPLFYNDKSRSKATGDDPTKPPRHRAIITLNRIGQWVREIGVTDKAIRPNHAWRHTFKRRAARAGIEAGVRNAICGHSPRDVADLYETPTLSDMAAALKKFPRYDVSGAEKYATVPGRHQFGEHQRGVEEMQSAAQEK
jgi:integrase